MFSEIAILSITAASVGFFHTLLGPDHYIPFIVLSKARNWSKAKTAVITALCGLGHILSSITLGFLGIFLGLAVFKLQKLESFRGDIAAWLFIAFGFTYFVWGLHRAIRSKTHKHTHYHEDGIEHLHLHKHIEEDHLHLHERKDSKLLTTWVLFIIFVFGPCEPLIPLLFYAGSKYNLHAAFAVSLAFGVVTIMTMIGIVFASLFGLRKIQLGFFEKYSHAMAGMAILLCGMTVKFLGL